MLFAWETTWDKSFDQLNQKIAQLKSGDLLTESDSWEEALDYSSDKIAPDEKLDQLKDEIKLLTNDNNYTLNENPKTKSLSV